MASVSSDRPRAARWRVPIERARFSFSVSGRIAMAAAMRPSRTITAPSWSALPGGRCCRAGGARHGVDPHRLAGPRVEGDLALEGDRVRPACAWPSPRRRPTTSSATSPPREPITVRRSGLSPMLTMPRRSSGWKTIARMTTTKPVSVSRMNSSSESLEPSGDAHQSAEDHEESDQAPRTRSRCRGSCAGTTARCARPPPARGPGGSSWGRGSSVGRHGRAGPRGLRSEGPWRTGPGLPLWAAPVLHGSAGSAGCGL